MTDKPKRYGESAANPNGTPQSPDRCIEEVSRPDGWGTHQCDKNRKPGTEWCGTHSPEAKARRTAKSDERARKEREAWDRKRDAVPNARAEGFQTGLEMAARHLETKSRGTEREDEYAVHADIIRAFKDTK